MAIDGIKEEKIRDGYKKTEIGEIPIDWEVNELSNICRVITGSTPKTSEKNNFGNEHPWVTPIDLGNKKYINKTNRTLSEIGFKKTRILPEGSILVTCIGSTIGKIGIANSKLSTNQQINSLIVKDKNILKEYIYYSLKYFFNKYKETYISHEAVPIINKGIFQKFKVAIPTYSEQQKIASILSTVDVLIENTDYLINSYSLLKKSLMQTLLAKGIGHKKFKKTEIGEIPEEWQICELINVRDTKKKNSFIDGDWIESEYIINFEIRLIQTGNIGIGTFIENKNKKYISEKTFDALKCKEVEVGDLLICRMAEPTGRSCIIPDLGNKMITSVDCVIVKINEENYDKRFINYYLNTESNLKNILKFEQGTTRRRISRKNLEKILIPVPKLQEQKQISDILSTFDENLENYIEKKEKLGQLKKGLMQQLLTGKIRVKI